MSFRISPTHIKQTGVNASVKKIPIPILKQVCGGWNQTWIWQMALGIIDIKHVQDLKYI